MKKKMENYRVERWKSSLETDIKEFCNHEGIAFGEGILSGLHDILFSLYNQEIIKTLKDLVCIPKHKFLGYCENYGDAEEKTENYWNKMNYILKKHGYRMYVKPIVLEKEE